MASAAVPRPRPSQEATVEPMSDPESLPAPSKARLFPVLAALYAAVFVAALDDTVVATAAPTISHALGSASGYTWLRAAYSLASTAAGPTWTNFSDIWGRKPVILSAIFTFVVSSVICGRATSMAMLIAGRALQGAGAGGILLLTSVIISDLFDLRKRTLYLGGTEIFWALSGAVGPVLGGALSEYASWRWIWYINVPIGLAIFGILVFLLDVHNPRTPLLPGLAAIDWGGSFILLAVTIMVLLGINFGGQAFAWTSPQVLSLILVGLASSAFFFLIEAKFARYPVMPLKLFRNVSNASALLLVFLHGIAMMGAEYYLPFYFQSCRDAKPFRAGLLALPFVFVEAIFGASGGLIVHRTGKYLPVIRFGVLLMTLGMGLFIILKPTTPVADIMIFQIIAAAGSGLIIQPPITAIQANVAQRDTASATATLMFMQNLASAISVVIGGTIFSNSMTVSQSKLLDAGIPERVAQMYTGESAAANVLSLDMLDNIMELRVIQRAYAWSIRNMWIFYAGVSALSVLTTLFIKSRELSSEHTETRTGLRDEAEDGNGVELSTPSPRTPIS